MFMLCTKMLGLAPMIGFQHHDIFPETDWSEFFLNTKVKLCHIILFTYKVIFYNMNSAISGGEWNLLFVFFNSKNSPAYISARLSIIRSICS